jgi:hypothetical protein
MGIAAKREDSALPCRDSGGGGVCLCCCVSERGVGEERGVIVMAGEVADRTCLESDLSFGCGDGGGVDSSMSGLACGGGKKDMCDAGILRTVGGGVIESMYEGICSLLMGM